MHGLFLFLYVCFSTRRAKEREGHRPEEVQGGHWNEVIGQVNIYAYINALVPTCIYLYIFVYICIYLYICISLLAQRIAGACSVQGRWVEGFSGEWKEGRHVSCENMFSFIFFFSVFFSPFFYTQFAFAQKVQKLTHAKLGSLLVSMYVFVCVCGDAHYALYMYICVSICIRHFAGQFTHFFFCVHTGHL